MAIVNELPKTLSVLTTLTVYQMKNDKSYILNSKNDKRYDNMIFPSCQENNNFGVKRLQCSKVYWYKLIKLVKRQIILSFISANTVKDFVFIRSLAIKWTIFSLQRNFPKTITTLQNMFTTENKTLNDIF